MQSIYIKEEPNLLDVSENQQNSNNDILTASSDVVFQIKSELIDDEFTISEFFIDNSYRRISIIKKEVDISDDNESDEKIIYNDNLEKNQKYNCCETEYTNVKWPSKYKSIDRELKPNSTSANNISKNQCRNASIDIVSINNKSLKSKNVIGLKDAKVVLERMPISKILGFRKVDSLENIDQIDDVNKTWSSFCKLHCSRCNKTTNAMSIFKATECRTCNIVMSLQCKKCERLFNTPKAMYYHLMSRCYPRKKYNCAHCNYETTVRDSIHRHLKRRHNENNQPIECPKCHKTSKHIHAFRVHQKRCKMEGRFSCTICPYKSHFSKAFNAHMASHERFNKLFQESRSNANDKSMIDDINSESTTVLEKWKILINFERFCPQCNTTFENNMFNNSRSVNLMYECHLCKTRVLLQCRKCNIRLNDVKKMKEHLLTKCALKINYKCPECDHETVYKHSLKGHIRRRHAIIDPKELKKCPKCDKTFKIIYDFNKHLKSCGNELYNYHCDHCFFKTNEKRSMRFHAQKHMNTYAVKVQKKSGKQYGLKAYCSTCNALTIVGRHSKMLCRQCKNLMMFKCRNCDEKAPTKKDIHLHESKRHGYVYHYCPNCDKAFLRLSSLKNHKKICKSKSTVA